MIKIDIDMPMNCTECTFCQMAFDSELFKNGEQYCCIKIESVDKNVQNGNKPEWCPLITVEHNSSFNRKIEITKENNLELWFWCILEYDSDNEVWYNIKHGTEKSYDDAALKAKKEYDLL